jgi:hypothetical protein
MKERSWAEFTYPNESHVLSLSLNKFLCYMYTCIFFGQKSGGVNFKNCFVSETFDYLIIISLQNTLL